MAERPTIRVRPVPGKRFMLHTMKGTLDAEREVPELSYYRRAILRGDIEEVTEKKPNAKPAKTEG